MGARKDRLPSGIAPCCSGLSDLLALLSQDFLLLPLLISPWDRGLDRTEGPQFPVASSPHSHHLSRAIWTSQIYRKTNFVNETLFYELHLDLSSLQDNIFCKLNFIL